VPYDHVNQTMSALLPASFDASGGMDRFDHYPLTGAIWRTLMSPVNEVIEKATSQPTRMCTIELIAAQLVLRALMGDVKAFAEIANRIEGRPGFRRAEAEGTGSPELQATIQTIVGAYVEAVRIRDRAQQ
jgi:hypothetical protein